MVSGFTISGENGTDFYGRLLIFIHGAPVETVHVLKLHLRHFIPNFSELSGPKQ